MQKKRGDGLYFDPFNSLTEVPMSSTHFIARMNDHIAKRAQLLAALDKAISNVGQEQVARALINKAKATV